MRVIRAIGRGFMAVVRIFIGPTLFKDRPADQSVLGAKYRYSDNSIGGSERIISVEDSVTQAQDAARDTRSPGGP